MIIVIFALLYLIVPPGVFIGGKALKEYLKRQLFGRKRSATALRAEATKEGFNRKASKRIQFAIRDPRKKPIPFKLIFMVVYGTGLLVAAAGGFGGSWKTLLTSFIFSYTAFLFAYFTADKTVLERDQVLKRMLEMKGSKMRFVNRDKGAVPTPASEFKVIEWSEDLISPVKMYLYMPTDFDILEVDRFLESFNLIFGSNGQWIADDTDKQHGGFDFNAGVAAIRVSTPLPKMAMWHERYLNKNDVHWSFFPLALGAENGVPVYNDELDITEHVLGFAVNGGQEKLSKNNGVRIGPEITSSPQILIAGGTGGGKSLEVKTEVQIIKQDNNRNHSGAKKDAS